MKKSEINSIIAYSGFVILLLFTFLKYGTDIDLIHLIGITLFSFTWLVFWKGLNYLKRNKKQH
ncbi:MAG: hypothetical protein MK105_15035 [Crocinitomicaceae bacterium]|nr:hypothetical protein [Crocinitomicaceae bacterium]